MEYFYDTLIDLIVYRFFFLYKRHSWYDSVLSDDNKIYTKI